MRAVTKIWTHAIREIKQQYNIGGEIERSLFKSLYGVREYPLSYPVETCLDTTNLLAAGWEYSWFGEIEWMSTQVSDVQNTNNLSGLTGTKPVNDFEVFDEVSSSSSPLK